MYNLNRNFSVIVMLRVYATLRKAVGICAAVVLIINIKMHC